MPFPVSVVELSTPPSVIETRLASAVAAGRTDDLHEARRWFGEGLGVGLGDVQIVNDRPVRDVAGEILDWLGWRPE